MLNNRTDCKPCGWLCQWLHSLDDGRQLGGHYRRVVIPAARPPAARPLPACAAPWPALFSLWRMWRHGASKLRESRHLEGEKVSFWRVGQKASQTHRKR